MIPKFQKSVERAGMEEEEVGKEEDKKEEEGLV